MATSIDETARIHPGAKLGADVVVGPYCMVGDNVVIGDGTVLEAFAQVKPYTRMGANNHIHSYAIIGGEPQHLGFKGEETWVEMGDGNIVREFVTIHRGTVQGHGKTVIGSRCLLMAYVHIAHDCILGDNVIMSNASSLAGHVTIGDGAIVSGMSGVHQFVRIGEFAFLGAMGGFGQDIPPYTIATGVRAKLHGLNKIGLRRRGFDRDTITALKRAYRKIFRSDMIREEALEEVQESLGHVPQVMKLVEFVKNSPRGVTPSARTGTNGLPAEDGDVNDGDSDE
ncbi:Acyl-(acyl-carrier-protein)--UDP-N-acetylglucosamine O-acyltransferase [Desulfovibrio sp. X2]|uniref:acyl-ACP--UDP-N-acetylglucosamine O-acyltransferase n=1 Tax=Desulfovibrio sp. X2 TaxID=941449 RepID=UPI000358939F|nr:acyl-ACP--UDP-N-acetylglucosamine O-acyltransferase [Desulfovibrio sp. X2]EPR37471.1 Acyl-(acyl-carrier-protein)--UDP-N-acetylglucosamine O-acyltransferase [Desulfovibrio sp. X2]